MGLRKEPLDPQPKARTVSVIIVFHGPLYATGVAQYLATIPGVRIVACATDGQSAVAFARSRKPQVIVLEECLPKLNGIEAVSRIVRVSPRTRVVLIVEQADPPTIIRALRAGAHAVLVRAAAVNEVARAVLGEGATPFLCRRIPQAVARHCLRVAKQRRNATQVLTPRQGEVLQMLAEGYSVKAIASLLRISGKTVETHKQAISSRLGIHDVAGLVRYAIREGIVRP